METDSVQLLNVKRFAWLEKNQRLNLNQQFLNKLSASFLLTLASLPVMINSGGGTLMQTMAHALLSSTVDVLETRIDSRRLRYAWDSVRQPQLISLPVHQDKTPMSPLISIPSLIKISPMQLLLSLRLISRTSPMTQMLVRPPMTDAITPRPGVSLEF